MIGSGQSGVLPCNRPLMKNTLWDHTPEGGSSPITRLPIFRKRHTTIDKSKRTASTTDLQGHCNLRQNSVSSASSYRVICVRLRGNLHQVTAQSASSYNLICNWLKNQEAAGDTTTRNGIKQGRPLTGNLNISREASARYQRRKADKWEHQRKIAFCFAIPRVYLIFAIKNKTEKDES